MCFIGTRVGVPTLSDGWRVKREETGHIGGPNGKGKGTDWVGSVTLT